jgi:NitT/TauT family transport system substrate-binding protein
MPRSKKNLRPIFAAFMSGAMAFSLSACSGAAPADSGSTAAQTKITYGNTPGNQEYLPLWIAEEKGFFADQGITAQAVNVDSGPAGNTLLIGGSLDLALLPVSAVFQDWENKKPVQIVSGSKTNLGVTIIGKAGSDFPGSTPEDKLRALKGKKISVPARGSLIELQVAEALESVGMDPSKDVTFIAVASRPDTLAGVLTSGAADVIATTGVVKVDFVERGLAQIVLQLNEVGGKDQGADLVFGMDKNTVSKDPDAVTKVNAALNDSISWMKDPANTKELAELYAKRSPSNSEVAEHFATLWDTAGLNESGNYSTTVSEANYDEAVRFAGKTSEIKSFPAYTDVVIELAR